MATRMQSRDEEITNRGSHGVALPAALAAGPRLIAAISPRGLASFISPRQRGDMDFSHFGVVHGHESCFKPACLRIANAGGLIWP